MDEPASALDPIVIGHVEDLILDLKEGFRHRHGYTMQSTTPFSDETAFFHLGAPIAGDMTDKIFTNSVRKQTENYATDRFC